MKLNIAIALILTTFIPYLVIPHKLDIQLQGQLMARDRASILYHS